MDSWQAQMRKGVVDLAILARVALGETYGYEVVESLQSLDGLALTESTVYPALARLARDGTLAVRSAASPSGPTRRYYRLTPEGQARFETMKNAYRSLSNSLTKLLEGASS